MKAFEIKFSLADKQYMTALRLAVGAVCAAADVDIDGAEDMKVCVTESCLILQGCGFESVRVSLSCNGGFCAVAEGEGGKPVPYDNGFSLALISALVTNCDIEENGGVTSKISLEL